MSPLKLNSLNVHQLIDGCLKKDRWSCEQLFHTYAGKMMSICRRYASSQEEADDILQEGFINVFTNLSSYNFSGSFEGWMRRVFINSALKFISKRKFTEDINHHENSCDQEFEPDILSRLSEEEIIKCISELPEGYRLVFNLYIIEGYSHKEISKILHMEESTSRSQLVKAKRSLQKRILELQKIAV
jgi:RNA polymerase sigma factor (sigma-70 family)